MSIVSDRFRIPAGVRAGGQFAAERRSETDVALATPPAPREVARGVYEVADSLVEIPDTVRPGTTLTHLESRACLRARFEAAALRMQLDEQVDTLDGKLTALHGKQATVLLADPSGSVRAHEGRVGIDVAGQLVLFAKGSRDRGVVLRPNPQPYGAPRPAPQVLGVVPGYGGQQCLADRFGEHLAKTPELQPVSADGIPEDDGGEHDDIAAVFVYRHPGFDGDQDGRGSLFFATDITPGEAGTSDDYAAVNGYAVFSPSSGLVSEHGSMYLGDLKAWGGRVRGFRQGSMTFGQVRALARQVERDDDIQLVLERLV